MGGNMKKILTLFCLLFLTNSAYANGDIIENIFGDNYVYNDNRHKTVVKKVYPTKTIVKQVPVAVPVGVPAEIIPPVAPVVIKPMSVQVGRMPTATVPVAPVVAGVPVAVVSGGYVPVCRMVRSQAVVDQFGNVLDYVYTRVCN
jgi:hypothetical protein